MSQFWVNILTIIGMCIGLPLGLWLGFKYVRLERKEKTWTLNF